jgi:hypothetical protein
MSDLIRNYYERARAFEEEALRLFSSFETSQPRIISLAETRKKASALTVAQQDLFDQAIRCAEFGLARSAIVMAWAAFIDHYEQKLNTNIPRVHTLRPKWSKFTTIEELADNVPEHQLIELGREATLFRKSESKAVLGLLSKRNECAHPSPRNPGMNEAIGFISETLDRVNELVRKSF